MIQMNLSLGSSYPALQNTFSWSELPRYICFPYPSATIHLKGCLRTEQLFEGRIAFQTWNFYISHPKFVSLTPPLHSRLIANCLQDRHALSFLHCGICHRQLFTMHLPYQRHYHKHPAEWPMRLLLWGFMSHKLASYWCLDQLQLSEQIKTKDANK
jgi:hypothetical protein